jgi:hypothetical protein
MNMGRELTPAMKWLLGPLRWPISAVTVCALLFALWSARLPGGLIRNSISLWILIAIGVLWLVWPVLRLIVGRRCGWPQSLLMHGQRQRVLVGVIVLASAFAVWRNLPLKSAFAVSRPAMDRMARELIASGKPYGDDQWGVYRAKRIKAVPGGVRFTVEETDVRYKSGFIYLPNTDPKRTNWRSYRYIGGGWWAWREEN